MNETRWRISTDGGLFPPWAPDGRELFYQRTSPDATLISGGDAPGYREQQISLMAVEVETEPSFSRGNPRPVVEGPYLPAILNSPQPFGVSLDGQRFLMIKEAPDTSLDQQRINVVLSWHQELLERVPVN